MRRAAEKLTTLGAKAVLMKGGHLESDRVVDLLYHDGRIERFEDTRIESRSTHGTGCTLASAIAAGIAQKMSLRDAVARARAYVRRAIETAPGYGRGHGPLNHAVTLDRRLAKGFLELGILLSDQQRYSVAIQQLRHAAQLEPDLAQAHYRLAQAYQRTGQKALAAKELEIFKRLASPSAGIAQGV